MCIKDRKQFKHTHNASIFSVTLRICTHGESFCIDELVLMAKEETVLQNMTDKLIETGRYYGMEMNVEKRNKSNGNFKTTTPSKNYDRP